MKTIIVRLPVLALLFLAGCAGPKLAGTVNSNYYTGARGDYTVPFPVIPESEGRVAGDDRNGVTFRDWNGSRISFYSFLYETNSLMMEMTRTNGCQKALEKYVSAVFRVDSTHYHPEIMDGTISFFFLKGGVTPCGAAAFIHSNYLYSVEDDLPKAVQLLKKDDYAYQQKVPDIMEENALRLIQTIQIKN